MFIHADNKPKRNDGNSELVCYYLQEQRKMSSNLSTITAHLKSTKNHRSMKKKVGIIKSLIERNSVLDEKISEQKDSVSNSGGNSEEGN